MAIRSGSTHEARVRMEKFMWLPESDCGSPRKYSTDLLGALESCSECVVPYFIASYASVQKSMNTLGGSGESIIRCVKRMPIIPSRGSV